MEEGAGNEGSQQQSDRKQQNWQSSAHAAKAHDCGWCIHGLRLERLPQHEILKSGRG